MFNYTAYCLGIHSTLPLPQLISGSIITEVLIQKGKIDKVASEITDIEQFLLYANTQEVCFYNKTLGAFLVRNGREIIVDAESDIEDDFLSQFILGLPLATLLHQRGLLILHASAVVINGNVVAFLGKSGEGKSTIAATLYQQNYPLVTDDILALQIEDNGKIMILPSYPQLRLLPSSLRFLGKVPETLPKVYRESEKRSQIITDYFPQQPLPLKRIYVLTENNKIGIEKLTPEVAFMEITRQSYPDIKLLKSMGTAKLQFEQCVKLARSTSICYLQRPRDLSLLPDILRLVEEDLD